MNFAWALFWGGSRSTKPCIFPCKVVAAGDERYLCVRWMRLRSFRTRWVPPLCSATSGCVCVRSSMRFLKICGWRSHWNGSMIVVIWCCHARRERCRFARGCCETYCNGCMNFAWALFWGGSRSTKPCIFPCKVVAAGDERYLCVRQVRLRSFRTRWVPPLCSATSGCVCVRSSMRFLKICGWRSHWNGCMIVVIWCCHACREIHVCYGMLRNVL